MAGGSDVAEALSCAQCGKPAHLQYVVIFLFQLIVGYLVLVYSRIRIKEVSELAYHATVRDVKSVFHGKGQGKELIAIEDFDETQEMNMENL